VNQCAQNAPESILEGDVKTQIFLGACPQTSLDYGGYSQPQLLNNHMKSQLLYFKTSSYATDHVINTVSACIPHGSVPSIAKFDSYNNMYAGSEDLVRTKKRYNIKARSVIGTGSLLCIELVCHLDYTYSEVRIRCLV
jgi:hypothetical protein